MDSIQATSNCCHFGWADLRVKHNGTLVDPILVIRVLLQCKK